MTELQAEQQAAVEACLQGRNVFLTGSAGVGKSVTLGRIRSALEEKHGADGVVVASPTGISAILVGGATIYAAFKVHPSAVAKGLVKKNKLWTGVRALIIDEVSMLDPALFAFLDRQARCSLDAEEPFGGVQIVAVGDFFQLPPVKGGDSEFVFETPVWEALQMQTIELKTVHRQTDKAFVEVLERIRRGQHTAADTTFLQNLAPSKKRRRGKEEVDEDVEKIEPTKLFCKRLNEHLSNVRALAKIKGPSVCYTLSMEVEPGKWTSKQMEMVKKSVLKHFVVPERLELKVGAQVMLLANLSLPMGLANGARGVVVGFDEGPDRWPICKFDQVERCIVRTHTLTTKADRGITVTTVAVPLKLAWAITIHKSQGQSIDRLTVDLSDAFAFGQVYTALSRAKATTNLQVINFKPERVKAHPKVVEFYRPVPQPSA